MGKLVSFFSNLLKNLTILFARPLKRRLLFLIAISIVAIAGLLLIFMNSTNRNKVVLKGSNQTPVKINRLQIIVPEGAFPSSKKFIITELDQDSSIYDYAVKNEKFVSDVYKVSPEDGKKELSLLPLTLRYAVPSQYYLGDNFYNLSLGYLDENTKVTRRFYGSEIVKDSKGIYIEAKTFHTSIIGLIADKPINEGFGLKEIIDKPANYKPYLLIVPGIDENFSGSIPNTYSENKPAGRNFWEILFPDRSIWLYNYPLKVTRPSVYVEAARSFFKNFGRTDYVVYEAKRLSTELKRIPFKFDIIAHGIGGLIVRYALESDQNIKNVRKVVIISTPNLGTNLANPVYLSLLYGKSNDALAKIYDADVDSISYIKSAASDYLEKINVFWESIKPGSKTLKELNSFGLRKDIDYLAICGSTTNFPVNIKHSQLSNFYPEFVKGLGDGVVTIKSATFDGKIKAKIFKHSFYDIYFQKDVLETIKKFIDDIKPPEEYVFKNDEFLEEHPTGQEGEFFNTPTTIESSKKTTEVTSTGSTPTKSEEPKVKSNININVSKYSYIGMKQLDYRSKKLIEIYGNARRLFSIGDSLFVLCDNQLIAYNKNDNRIRLITNVTEDSFANIWKDQLLIYDGSEIKAFNENGDMVWKREANIEGKLLDLYMTKDMYYSLFADDGKLIYKVFDKNFNILFSKEVKGINGHLKYSPKYNQLFIVTNDQILCYEISINRELFEKTESSFRKYAKIDRNRRLEFSDVERIGEWLIILTKEYEIFANNLLNGKVVNLGFGDVGSNKLLFDGSRTIYIFGEKTLNFLMLEQNAKQKIIKRDNRYVKFQNKTIIDATVFKGKLYTIVHDNKNTEIDELLIDF